MGKSKTLKLQPVDSRLRARTEVSCDHQASTGKATATIARGSLGRQSPRSVTEVS